MLFNSLPFLFGFLPLTFAGFYLLGRWRPTVAAAWLALASLFFYGWWNPQFVALLLLSVIFNYGAGRLISVEARKIDNSRSGLLLFGAIACDLLLLGYFKYANFFITALGDVTGLRADIGQILLPLGISFFTFTQIAFLADCYQRKAKEFNFVHYLLFVSYFPHLIAGPILHHSQMMPQFARRETYRIEWTNISAGLTVFVLGLAKKVLIADTFAGISTPVFTAVSYGAEPPLLEAWTGALAYTLQLYFDFSGYSDMAIGLSLFFNIKLPLNFNSPYKATSMIDFWRRWHMTLSAFLRDYLYVPLGGNRKGKARRYVNLLVTMLLGGLWHGAGWTFIVWGALHGFYLIVNHAFRAACSRLHLDLSRYGLFASIPATAFTFFFVVIAWVFFRASDLHSASIMLQGMMGVNGLRQDGNSFITNIDGRWAMEMVCIGLLAVWALPNTAQFMTLMPIATETVPGAQGPAARLVWRPTNRVMWASIGTVAAICLLTLSAGQVSEFLYYQF